MGKRRFWFLGIERVWYGKIPFIEALSHSIKIIMEYDIRKT